MSIQGRVHSFETFGTVDGPGIRFVIFVKGCQLRCKYCHNRDTWSTEGARLFTADEVLTEIKKYKNYIAASNGGVTVSGGEPLLQPEFVRELFIRCKKEGIHTAIDTSGNVDVENVRSVLELTDLVLLDLKHPDAQRHEDLTGVRNDKIKAFTRYLSDIGKPVWIRYVLVPGLTDSREDLMAAHDYLMQFKNIEKIEVLPYHSMGKDKWYKLGLKYPLEDVEPPNTEDTQRARRIITQGKE